MTSTGYFRVGDNVVSRGQTYPQLIVTGFLPLYVGRLSGYERPSGVYLDPSHVAVSTPEGIQRSGYFYHTALAHADEEIAAARAPRTPHPEPIRVSDLPSTDFWEGDRVETDDGRQLYVAAIDYDLFVTGTAEEAAQQRPYVVNDQPRPVKIYRDDNGLGGADGEFINVRRLQLIDNGNAFRHHHGDPTSFASLQDEVLFHLMMGWFEPHANPIYTVEEAHILVTAGDADGFFMTGMHILTRSLPRCVRLTKADARVREAFKTLSIAATEDQPAFLLP